MRLVLSWFPIMMRNGHNKTTKEQPAGESLTPFPLNAFVTTAAGGGTESRRTKRIGYKQTEEYDRCGSRICQTTSTIRCSIFHSDIQTSFRSSCLMTLSQPTT